MVRNLLILILGFYLLVLLQTSFFAGFKAFGIAPNFILISVILISFIEKPEQNMGMISAIIGGVLLDIFSIKFMGFNILILIAVAVVVKFFLRNYVRIPNIQKY